MVRGMPLTSNQFEMVETWEERRNGAKRELVTQVTFYDPIALVAPQSAVYVHESRPDLEEAGATVEIEDLESGERVRYQIVGDVEADIRANRISVSSPVARALIGKTSGDVVEV